MKWSALSPRQFYALARAYSEDHGALYEYCLGNGLAGEADAEALKR